MKKTKIKKLLKELIVFVVLASIVLSFANMFSAASTAYGASIDGQAQYLIAAKADTAPPPVPTSAGSDGKPPVKGSTASESQGGDPPTTTTPTTPDVSPDSLIPIGTQGYEELWYLKQTSPIAMLNELVWGIFKNIKYVLGSVAILFVVIAAIKLIVAGDNEDLVTKQKLAITYAIIGLAVVGFSDEIWKVMAVACPEGSTECSKGGFLSSHNAIVQQSSIFNREVKIFITFIKYLIGSIAVLMLVRNGIRFVALAGAEESVTLDKKDVAFTSVGLVMIIIASTVIDKVFYIVDTNKYPTVGGVRPAINPDRGVEELAGITNLAVSLAAPIAILSLIIGAVMYATAGGDEERMKKGKSVILFAIIGLIMIYGAFAIISGIISGQFTA